MTAEERAKRAVMQWHGENCWGYDPVQHAKLEAYLAKEIAEAERLAAEGAALIAVALERERCAKVAEGGNFLHDDAPTARFGREVAAAIRRG